MLTYTELKNNPRRFLAATSIQLDEFEHLRPAFAQAYAAAHSATHTQAGTVRLRQAGGGRKARLATLEDKLLFILIYQKTYPLQTMLGLQFGLSQSQANDWLQRLLPILNSALESLDYTPARDSATLQQRSAVDPQTPLALQLDGTERRRQRPQNSDQQREHYSGKKKPTRIKT